MERCLNLWQNPAYQASPYTPSNIYSAYDMNYIHSKGYYGNNTTIVVVDAYGDPSLGYDVSAFDNLTGLPPLNLTVTTPEGAITSTNSQWASETAIVPLTVYIIHIIGTVNV